MTAALPPYATPEQLGEWLEPGATDPAGVASTYCAMFRGGSPERVLARATELVEGRVLTGYTCNTDGTPHDEDVAAWLADAACAQVEYWGIVSEEHGVAGVTTGTLSAGGTSHNMPGLVGPRVIDILDRAGLRSPIGNGWPRYRRPFDIIAARYPVSA